MRFYLVTPVGEDTAWMVAAQTPVIAARYARNHWEKDGPCSIEGVPVPTKFMVAAMVDPEDWPNEPFSVPAEQKYEAEGFNALWEQAVEVEL